jgi:ATP-dependent 26S proteasome regulatory subunit
LVLFRIDSKCVVLLHKSRTNKKSFTTLYGANYCLRDVKEKIKIPLEENEMFDGLETNFVVFFLSDGQEKN